MHSPHPKPSFICTFFLVFALSLPFSALGCVPQEKQTLEELKDYFGPYNPAFIDWFPSVDCCKWSGVGCNSDGRVISLYLYLTPLSNRLELPSAIQGLTLLKSLKLYANSGRLFGPIPPAFGQLYYLQHLDLSGNGLSGPIPDFFAELERLKYIDLTANQFSGIISPTLGFLTELQTLKLGNNRLTGTIPPFLGNIRNLQYLDLSRNQLDQTIPARLGQLTKLTHLNLHQNQLTGSIPNELGQLPLKFFDVSNNQLVGQIPPGLSKFGRIRFSNNKGLCGSPLPPCQNMNLVGAKPEIVKQMLSIFG